MKSTYLKLKTTLLICFVIIVIGSCKKDFLNAKPSTGLLLLKTISDYQLLLSNTTVLNRTSSLPLVSSDEYTVPDYTVFLSFQQQTTKNAYVWAKNLYTGEQKIQDWNVPYSAIFYANNILDALAQDNEMGSSEWNRTKGWALFVRAFAFYDLAQNFCATYDASTAATDKGLPLRLKPGIDELLPRSSLKETYTQILRDLAQAKELLTNNLSTDLRNEPSKVAALALFSRIYLSMRDYGKAEVYSDSCLAMYDKLIDYNTVSLTASNPFSYLNEETIYQSAQTSDHYEVTTSTTGHYSISEALLDLYDEDDLRPSIFFRTHANGNVYMKLGYSANTTAFTGLATDEIYLIKAECAARRSETPVALYFINSLLIKRYKTGTFIPLTAATPADALEIVLTERRKELPRRGLRWSDLKRLNKEGANITLSRELNGETYTLAPNDPRYIFPIPDDEIIFSGIDQNIR